MPIKPSGRPSTAPPVVVLASFIQTLLERDFPQWGITVPATPMGRFWTMLAHYHGQTWNAAEPARALGAPPAAVRRCLDVLTDAMMVRQLRPWFANLRKREVTRFSIRPASKRHEIHHPARAVFHPRLRRTLLAESPS